MSRFKYLVNCVECDDGNAINDMKNTARQITRETFLKWVDRASLASIERRLGYERWPAHGLTMAGDWHIAYYRGKFQGVPAVFFVWSGIEYIFTEGK